MSRQEFNNTNATKTRVTDPPPRIAHHTVMRQRHDSLPMATYNVTFRTLHPDNNYRYYCDIAGTGSGHERTHGTLSHHSEGRGRWLANFPLGDSPSADCT